jgi:hypothetical protein
VNEAVWSRRGAVVYLYICIFTRTRLSGAGEEAVWSRRGAVVDRPCPPSGARGRDPRDSEEAVWSRRSAEGGAAAALGPLAGWAPRRSRCLGDTLGDRLGGGYLEQEKSLAPREARLIRISVSEIVSEIDSEEAISEAIWSRRRAWRRGRRGCGAGPTRGRWAAGSCSPPPVAA